MSKTLEERLAERVIHPDDLAEADRLWSESVARAAREEAALLAADRVRAGDPRQMRASRSLSGSSADPVERAADEEAAMMIAERARSGTTNPPVESPPTLPMPRASIAEPAPIGEPDEPPAGTTTVAPATAAEPAVLDWDQAIATAGLSVAWDKLMGGGNGEAPDPKTP